MATAGDVTPSERAEVVGEDGASLLSEDCVEVSPAVTHKGKAKRRAARRASLKRAACVENLQKMYKDATKMIIERQLYGTLENFRLELEKWIEERHDDSLEPLSVPPEEMFENNEDKDSDSAEEEGLYESPRCLSSEAEEDENIYEEMAPLRLSPEPADQGKDETIICEDYMPPRKNEEDKQIETYSSESNCCCACLCVNVVKPEGLEEEDPVNMF